MLTLATAIISDIVVFKDAILQFIGGIIATVFIFIIMIIAMIASIILIFGFFLLKENGFWPLQIALGAFRDILNDIEITSQQISTFKTLRIIFLIICIITLVLSIIAKHRKKEQKKKDIPLRGMSVTTFVFSILGIVTALSLLAIASAIG